jgi:hypothetical protein
LFLWEKRDSRRVFFVLSRWRIRRRGLGPVTHIHFTKQNVARRRMNEARQREEGRGKREEGRGKREEGRGKREDGRGKREERFTHRDLPSCEGVATGEVNASSSRRGARHTAGSAGPGPLSREKTKHYPKSGRIAAKTQEHAREAHGIGAPSPKILSDAGCGNTGSWDERRGK